MITIKNKPRAAASVTASVLVIAIALLSFIGCSERTVSFDGIPQYVCDAAASYVKDYFQNYRSDLCKVSDWRITSLELIHTYDDFDGRKLDAYCVNFDLFSEDLSKMPMAGGMFVAEEVGNGGWFCPDYRNMHYLIFEGEKFLLSIGSNDSQPGNELFDSELQDALDRLSETQDITEMQRQSDKTAEYRLELAQYEAILKEQTAELAQYKAMLKEQTAELEQYKAALKEQAAELDQLKEALTNKAP